MTRPCRDLFGPSIPEHSIRPEPACAKINPDYFWLEVKIFVILDNLVTNFNSKDYYMKIMICMSDYFTATNLGRWEYTRICLMSLKSLGMNYAEVYIHSNPLASHLVDYKSRLLQEFTTENFRIIWQEVSLDNWLHLCWQHKNLLPYYLESNFDLFIYTENDYCWYRHHLDYFMSSRQTFRSQDLNHIPGFLRTEITMHNTVVSVDWQNMPGYAHLKSINVQGDLWYSSKFPYQGLMILDKELAVEHVTSYWSDVHTALSISPWPTLETSNAGLIWHNVPQGFEHRIVINPKYIDACTIYHLPNKYVQNPTNEPYSTIPITDFKISMAP
jgi:hypothetical protein